MRKLVLILILSLGLVFSIGAYTSDGTGGGDSCCGGSPSSTGGSGSDLNPDFSYKHPEPIVGESIEFTDESTTEDGDSIDSVEWDWQNDNADSNPDATGSPSSHSFSSTGTYSVNMSVEDSGGSTGYAVREVTVSELDARFIFEPASPGSGLPVEFDASDSRAVSGIQSFEWDWTGDGTFEGSGETASHAFPSPGTYSTVLKITDNNGNTNRETHQIEVTSTTECNNNLDEDDDGAKNYGENSEGDIGCVAPAFKDDIEGNIWDTDLTTTMNGESPSLSKDESVFFKGTVKQSNDFNTDENKQTDTKGSNSLTENFIKNMGTEGNHYANGSEGSIDHSYSGDLVDGRIIDAPNDVGGGDCGDGIENDGDGTSDDWENCPADYGDLSNDNIKEANIDGKPAQTTECEPDGPLKKEDADPDSCSCGGGSGSCTSSEEGDVYWAPGGSGDNSDDNGNFYWTTKNDQTLVKQVCEETTSSTTEAESKDYEKNCQDSCYGGTYNETSDSCNSGTYFCLSDTKTCSGEEMTRWDRDHDEKETYDCNNKNEVYGGGENNAGDSSNDKADNDAAATFVDHKATSEGEAAADYCEPEETLTVDADGPRGNGDGFVVLHDNDGDRNPEIVATESPDTSDSVGVVHYGRDGSVDSTTDLLDNKLSKTCEDGKTTCLKYVDFQTKSSGWGSNNFNVDSTVENAVKIDGPQTKTYTADDSYSVCKNINRINRNNDDLSVNSQDELIDCDYEYDRSGGSDTHDVSPLPEACGDEPKEHLIQFEGDEVDSSTVQSSGLAFSQKCVHWGSDSDSDDDFYGNELTSDACLAKGNVYSEGTVINVARESNSGYEAGGDSPDWEVCLNIPGNGDDLAWDNQDNDKSRKDYGGEWYDLDSEKVQNFIGQGNSDASAQLDTDLAGTTEIHTIDNYWRENPNPQDSDYNPEGREYGTAIEDDCGPNVQGCNDESGSSVSNKDASFFNFIGKGEGTNDDDYNPQGGADQGDEIVSDSFFSPHGQLNKLQEDSDQLEPGMDTTFPSNYGIWEDSVAGENEADMYALTESLTWSISNRGVPYAPGSAPYHADYSDSKRTDPDDNTVAKESKVFGNSFADVNDQGQGVWIDPDEIKKKWDDEDWGKSVSDWDTWKDKINYKNDITGPDAGLGFHLDSKDVGDPDYLRSGDIVIANIRFQGSGSNEYLEKPMCGDDQREYLLEERGEVSSSSKYSGPYACASARNHCVQESYGNRLHDTGTYLQANEPGEGTGRLKNDLEYCAERPSDEFPNWYDQDYGHIDDDDGDGVIGDSDDTQDTCKTNNLYGALGKRWFSESDVKEYPNAFTGGIDDDSNQKLEDAELSNLESQPEKDGGWDLDSETPVSSGTINSNRNVSTLGFCGGDDESEYIVTQRCSTRLCETDNSVVGVAEDPDYCLLSESVDGVDFKDSIKRDLFEQGETVNVDTGSDTKAIACYGGEWHEDWPVVFLRDSTAVPLGSTDRVSFQVINVKDEAGTFDLELSIGDKDLDSLTTFEETGSNEMSVSVPATGSETYSVEIKGNKEVEQTDVELTAESRDGQLEGYDTLQASITSSSAANAAGNVTQAEQRDVPGIGIVQLVWLATVATGVYFFTGRSL